MADEYPTAPNSSEGWAELNGADMGRVRGVLIRRDQTLGGPDMSQVMSGFFPVVANVSTTEDLSLQTQAYRVYLSIRERGPIRVPRPGALFDSEGWTFIEPVPLLIVSIEWDRGLLNSGFVCTAMTVNGKSGAEPCRGKFVKLPCLGHGPETS